MTKEVIILYDNNIWDKRLRAGFGFSCLLRLGEESVLFDTGGDSSTLLHNMRQLGIDPEGSDKVMLSHAHGDHVGGLLGFLRQNSNVTVYLPRSFPQSFKDEIDSCGAMVEEVAEARKLWDNVYTTGELGVGIKEQSLIVSTREGLVVVSGCAHPGVVNIVRRAKDVVGDKVYLVLGGFHLGGVFTWQLDALIEDFRKLGVAKVAPCHCSGEEARRLFQERYGRDCIECGVGQRITLPGGTNSA
jgi:7,8-dihydropterin-6-yl-methyl-4-(beta-D-ribofuranosyl)aminobenzene 5'-phosphate synthase